MNKDLNLRLLRNQSFEKILPEINNVSVNNHQICKAWFKAREWRPLSFEDTEQYQRLTGILKDVVELMEEAKITIQYEQLRKLAIFEKVCAIVTSMLDVEPSQITSSTNFTSDLGADSLDIAEMILALQETFNIEISAQLAKNLTTVQQAINYVSDWTLDTQGKRNL